MEETVGEREREGGRERQKKRMRETTKQRENRRKKRRLLFADDSNGHRLGGRRTDLYSVIEAPIKQRKRKRPKQRENGKMEPDSAQKALCVSFASQQQNCTQSGG